MPTKLKHIPSKVKAAVGELRQDLITSDWVVVAANRAKRPDDFSAGRKRPVARPKYKADCPFCNLAVYPQEPDVLRLPDSDDWQVHIFGNKYPAFSPREEFRSWTKGPYRAMESVGYHEVLATRLHNQFEALMSEQEMALVLEALVLRYRQLRVRPSVNYIQIIKNHGEEAGGSLEHPHHQIFTIPVLPRDVAALLRGAEEYQAKHSQEVFGAIIDFERHSGDRLVFENADFVVFCPFASRVPFETWIVPKIPQQFFEAMNPQQRATLAEAMHEILGRLYTGLNDPPYNYYIHSAPCDETGFVCPVEMFANFRWHIQILPRLTKFGGFELGTGLEINTTLPEEAAAWLRQQSAP